MALRLRGWSRAGAAALVSCGLLLTSCSRVPGDPAAPPTSSLGQGDSATSTSESSERLVRIGETVSIPFEDGSLSLTVEQITVSQTCPGRAVPTQEPELGQFVVLEVSAAADQGGGARSTNAAVPLLSDAFQLADASGELQRISTTGASWSCFEDAELVPPFVAVGESVHGKIVLDSVTPHGRVLYRLADEILVWEY